MLCRRLKNFWVYVKKLFEEEFLLSIFFFSFFFHQIWRPLKFGARGTSPLLPPLVTPLCRWTKKWSEEEHFFDWRMDNMCKNNDHYRPWLWVGRVDQNAFSKSAKSLEVCLWKKGENWFCTRWRQGRQTFDVWNSYAC